MDKIQKENQLKMFFCNQSVSMIDQGNKNIEKAITKVCQKIAIYIFNYKSLLILKNLLLVMKY